MDFHGVNANQTPNHIGFDYGVGDETGRAVPHFIVVNNCTIEGALALTSLYEVLNENGIMCNITGPREMCDVKLPAKACDLPYGEYWITAHGKLSNLSELEIKSIIEEATKRIFEKIKVLKQDIIIGSP